MSIQKSVLALRPVAYYPLQETAAGAIVDLSGNALNGATVGSGISYAQTGIWTPWSDQKLMTFPGTSNGYVSIPNFPSMGGSHTYSAWVRKNNTSLTHQAFLGQQGAAGPDACTYLKVADSSASTLYPAIVTVPMSGGVLSTTATTTVAGNSRYAMTSGTTYHLAVVVDLSVSPGTLSVYINGSLAGSSSLPSNAHIVPGKGNMVLGAGFYNGNVADYAGVSMAHVAFFSRALTSSEISRLYSVAMSNTGYTKITGTVRDGAGVGVARVVRVYSRADGRLLGNTTSASDGTYACPLFGGELEEVFVIALDDDSAPDYNAAIVDKQVPVGV